MKITDIYPLNYRWKKEKPIRNGAVTFRYNELHLAVVETDGGITGYGCSYNVDYIPFLKSWLIGEDPLDTERLWEKMWNTKFLGRRGIEEKSISEIDIALWDIKSKAAGLPLFQLLGGFRRDVPCYIAGGYYADGKSLSDLQQEMERYVSWGISNVKMKIGGANAAEDVQRVRAVRNAVGDEVRLMVDANCAYRPYEALEMSRRLEEYHPYWFEEPVMPDDYEGMSRFREKSCIPLATGENEYNLYGFRDLIDRVHPDILNPDACSMGGITPFVKTAAYAQAHNIALSPHGQQQLHIILDCALPGIVMAEFYPEQYDKNIYNAFKTPIHFNAANGTVAAPDVPGTGLEPDFDFLDQYRIS